MHGPASTGAGAGEKPGFREFVAIIASIMAMVALAIDSMLPALPAIGESLGVDEENQRQFVIAAFMIGFGVAQFFVGTLSDRFGRRTVLLWCLAFYTLFNLLAAAAPSFELLIAARVLQGASAAGGRVIVVSIVRDRYAGRQMARVMSLAFIVFMAAPIIAPAVGQAILLVAPWRWIFVALAVAGVAIGGWVAMRLPETLHPEDRLPITLYRIRMAYARVLGDRQSNGYTAAACFLTAIMMGYINSVQQIFESFGAQHLLAPIFAAMAGMMAIGSLINSRIVVRVGMRFIGHWALIGCTAFAAIHMLVGLSGHESLWTFSILQALMMGCFGLAASNFSAIAMENLGVVAGTASSLQGGVSTVIGALLGIAIGQSFDGTTVPTYTGFTLCGLAALAAILITERGRLFQRTV